MSGIQLKKGEAFNLTKVEGVNLNKKLTFGLGFSGKNGKSIDLDSYVAVLDKKDKVLDFVYFSNMKTKGIKHNGDDLVGGGKKNEPNETIDITLPSLDPKAAKLIIGLFVYSSGKSLRNVSTAFANITTKTGKELCRYNLLDFQKFKSVEAGHLIKNSSNEWSFEAIGKGYQKGYSKILKQYKRGNRNSSSNTEGRNFLDSIGEFIESIIDVFT